MLRNALVPCVVPLLVVAPVPAHRHDRLTGGPLHGFVLRGEISLQFFVSK